MNADGARVAWELLGAPGWPPAAGKAGPAGPCWLCGSMVAEGEGWRLKDFLTPTFTNHTLAAAPSSDTVCQPCVYLGSGESWRAYCASRPEMGLKAVHPLSWRSYSHVFAPGMHACPARAEWRRWLLEPPPPPFVFVLTETGKKHVIYRALASYDRDRYWLQVEEDRVLIDRVLFAPVLERFEALLMAGFTREEVRSGVYSQGRLLKGRGVWEQQEPAMRIARAMTPDWVRVCATVAHGPKKEANG